MSILAVMVRYNPSLQPSQAMRAVCQALTGDAALGEAYRLLIWDNGPEPPSSPSLPIPFEYRHPGHNLGISGACNEAARLAQERGHRWMLLLDEGTPVTSGFMRAMLDWSERLAGQSEIALIAPTVRAGGAILSPRQCLFLRDRAYSDPAPGIAEGEACAVNSGWMMRVAALRSVGGFSANFWLDYSDRHICHQLYLHGYKVWRATNAELNYEGSAMGYDQSMTPARYINFCYAESAFHDLYRGLLESCAQDLRLFLRAIKQRRTCKDPAYARITQAQLLYRLRFARSARIERWEQEGERRRAKMTLSDALAKRSAG